MVASALLRRLLVRLLREARACEVLLGRRKRALHSLACLVGRGLHGFLVARLPDEGLEQLNLN